LRFGIEQVNGAGFKFYTAIQAAFKIKIGVKALPALLYCLRLNVQRTNKKKIRKNASRNACLNFI